MTLFFCSIMGFTYLFRVFLWHLFESKHYNNQGPTFFYAYWQMNLLCITNYMHDHYTEVRTRTTYVLNHLSFVIQVEISLKHIRHALKKGMQTWNRKPWAPSNMLAHKSLCHQTPEYKWQDQVTPTIHIDHMCTHTHK